MYFDSEQYLSCMIGNGHGDMYTYTYSIGYEKSSHEMPGLYVQIYLQNICLFRKPITEVHQAYKCIRPNTTIYRRPIYIYRYTKPKTKITAYIV